jgi:hypothetical protein
MIEKILDGYRIFGLICVQSKHDDVAHRLKFAILYTVVSPGLAIAVDAIGSPPILPMVISVFGGVLLYTALSMIEIHIDSREGGGQNAA